tara:strand:+ start:14890 stop:15102 length:213 start_codon:yes stop_codon:yes gene_type:complete
MEDLEDGSVEKDCRLHGGGPKVLLISKNKASADKYVMDLARRFPMRDFLLGKKSTPPQDGEDAPQSTIDG